MSKSNSRADLSIQLGPQTAATPVDPQTPLRICILGDFSGRARKGIVETGTALAARRPRPVDRDNLDQLPQQLEVQLDRILIDKDGSNQSVRFHDLDDFHPDQLYEKLELFASLRQIRGQLLDAATFDAAAAEVRGWGLIGSGPEDDAETSRSDSPSQPSAGPTTATSTPTDGAGLLDQAIAATDRTGGERRGLVDWNAFVRDIVEPYVVDKPHPRQQELVACVDAVTSELMRSLLHHADFQALESAWRGLEFLVRGLETGTDLKIFVLDISKNELTADLAGEGDLESCGIYRLLVEQTVGTPGAEPWGLLVGHFPFGATFEDALLAGALAKVAARCGAPLVAQAGPRLVGCESFGKTPDPDDWQSPASDEVRAVWDEVRAGPDMSYLGLALPRFLLRLPYGTASRPVDRFEFEEMPDPTRHQDYLWGNPAVAVAYLLGAAFQQQGWQMTPGMVRDVAGLPTYLFQQDGESHVKPCAECALTDRAVERIAAAGLMPLVWFKDRDTVRLVSFQSVARPSRAIRGAWDG